MNEIFIVIYNRDWEESIVAFETRDAALADIAETFECEAEPGSKAFWQEVHTAYQASTWKGFQFVRVSIPSLKITDLDGVVL